MLGYLQKKNNRRRSHAARFFVILLLQPLQPTRLQPIIPAQKRNQRPSDRVHAARGVALDVQRHLRIVQRHAKQEPAVARARAEQNADTLAVLTERAAYKALSRVLRKADAIDTVHYALCDILEHGIMHFIRPNIRGKQSEILHAASSGGFQRPSLRFL